MRRILYLTIVVAFTGLLMPASAVYAASASMSLSASSSATKGSTLSVSIRENSGSEPVNAASATVSYPTGSLSYSSVSNSSAFGISAATSGGGGSVHVERGSLSAVTGSQTVATIKFKVLTDSGTATLAITSGQVLSANTNSNIASGFSGVSVALKAPAPTPQAPPADTIPPKVTDVKATNMTFNGTTITWTTSEPANSVVSYGPTNAYGLTASDGSLVTDHKIVLSSPIITAAETYHYSVKSADAAGNTTSSPDATFTTLGAKVPVKVVDQNNKPVSGAEVKIADSSAKTDSKGMATVSGVQTGKQTVVVNFNGGTYTKNIDVTQLDANGNTPTVNMQIKVTSNLWLPIIIVVLLILAVAAWLWKKGGLPPSITKIVPGGGKSTGVTPSMANPQPEPTVIKPGDKN